MNSCEYDMFAVWCCPPQIISDARSEHQEDLSCDELVISESNGIQLKHVDDISDDMLRHMWPLSQAKFSKFSASTLWRSTSPETSRKWDQCDLQKCICDLLQSDLLSSLPISPYLLSLLSSEFLSSHAFSLRFWCFAAWPGSLPVSSASRSLANSLSVQLATGRYFAPSRRSLVVIYNNRYLVLIYWLSIDYRIDYLLISSYAALLHCHCIRISLFFKCLWISADAFYVLLSNSTPPYSTAYNRSSHSLSDSTRNTCDILWHSMMLKRFRMFSLGIALWDTDCC